MRHPITAQEKQILHSIGEELNTIRGMRKMTYEDLARKSGYCIQHVWNLLHGRCSDFATMVKVANAMDASFWIIDNTKIRGDRGTIK